MKRNLGLTLIAMLMFVLVGLLLPPSSAKRNGTVVRHSKSTGPLDPSLFMVNRPNQSLASPLVMRAVGFAESMPVRDMPAAAVKPYHGKVRELEFFEKGDEHDGKYGVEVKNEKNREIIRNVDGSAPRTADQALSSNGPGANRPSPNPPNPPSLNFEGQSIADTIAIGQGFLPPDTNGDVGPSNYVQTVNVTFRIWDKAGNPLTPVASLNTLFGPLGGSCGGSEDGDPIVVYDQLADRWLISQFCTVADPNNHQLIAISKNGDPTGSYYLYNFMMPNNKFNDYPHFGMWPDAYYMTDNQFNQAGTTFLQDGVFAFDRTKMLVGDPTASFIYFDTAVLFPPGGANGTDGIGGMLPADMEGYIPPPAGAPCPFAYFQAGEFGDPADQLRIFDFHADFAVPANSTFTERTGSPLAVAAFDPVPVPNSRNVIPQPPPATAASFVDAITDRLMYRLSYRNLGSSEKLVANHTVNAATNPAFRAGVRWYELTRGTPAAAWTIAEQETWAPAGTEHRWMGSAASNFQNDVAVGFSVSAAAATFPSVRYAARLGTDTPGTGLIQGETSIVAGGGSQTSTSGRWGDYSDLTVDPSDDCTFWFTQEYYSVSSEPGNTTAPWHTRIAKFAPGPCATSPRGTISGTITNCASGLPIPNALVSVSGGYSRGTSAAGTYSAIVVPGTYNVSATGTGYDTASTTGLVVANGGNATFNACLNGNLRQPVADTASITADSCNSNGSIDPNETITVSLGVKNTGTQNTTNLVGTLQATGGVTSPSGPQNYGVVVAGGATVFRSFTFTAGNVACGSPIVLSLQLQDGPDNLGTVTYNFTTGTVVVNNYSTGDISVAIPDSPAPAINIPLTVADVMTLTDVNVSFRINHTFDGDLTIALVHPDNTVIPLVTNRGSSGANFGTGTLDCAGVPTVIDDQAATAISAGAAPFAASFRPESPLSALNGKPSNGTWNLRIQDTAGQDTGTVGCVKLELNKHTVCCGALINASPPPVITAESISPANNAADPEETVTVNLSLVNNGGSPTTNLVATLQPTGGVAGPSGPQSYGVLAASGGTATRPFTFTAQGTCGSTITLTLALQDGSSNLGTVTYTMTLGALVTTTTFSENFDGVTAPALPAGWVTAATGVEVAWVTSATNPNSAPNDAFAPDVSNIGNTTLDTPTINVPAGGAQLTFRNLFNMEASGVTPTRGFDGMVLEISINGGAFNDITTGGNAFIAGGYTRTIDATFGSPIAGRLAWSGLSGGTTAAPTYITSTINLPAAANGQPIKLRWRAATDNSAVAAGSAGVRVDNIVISGSSFVCNSQSCTITAPTSITIPPGTCGTIVNYVPAVSFQGACGVVQGPTPPSGSFFGIGTTTVFVRGTRADASFTDASFPVTVQESETQATGLGANVTNNYCNTTVTYTAVTGAGSTTVVDAPQQTLPPPYIHCASCPELNITTTSTFTAPVTTCITMPAATDFNTFTRLRILHGEPGLVNRTVSSSFASKTICARTSSVSPFVVALDPNAPTAAPAFISGRITTPDGQALAGVTLNLSGARNAKVITDAAGNYRFNNVDTENFYTVTPSILNYHFTPENLSFSLLTNKSDASFTASRDAVSHGNVIDTADYFVRQHYLDFLGREPDEAGFAFWTDQILSCGADADCTERRTINVSAAYFLSIENLETAGLVHGLYEASYGRRPQYAEFMPDRAAVAQNVRVGDANWRATLDANKQAFVQAWVERPAFQSAYG
ncbi:MAG TPA: carboxypeptidase regulatory-like domain-containing protein, partial [Pyrinomonadaceae bacterium]|nr:carboxypeptidase regulatory-like domain-containing protein [Pyrinomonadaceae bacterium]